MHTLRTALFAAALASLAVGGSILFAAEPSDTEETSTIQTTAVLSSGEMTAMSEANLKEMQNMLIRVVELQKLARKQKDVIKLNCVNDKLLQVKQLLNIAEAGRTNLVEAIAQDDADGSKHQLSQITIAKEKSAGLRDAAEACIGEELIFLGPTEVTVDKANVADDPTADDDFGDDMFDPPGFASPFS